MFHTLAASVEPFNYWWLVAAAGVYIVGTYVSAVCWYWWRLRNVKSKNHIAPISVKGEIFKDLGTHEVGLILLTKLHECTQTFLKATRKNAAIFVAESVPSDFPSVNAAMLDAFEIKIDPSELYMKEELVITIGPVTLPIGSIVNLFLAFLRVLPVPFRKRYLASLIYVSLVSVENETQLLIYRKGQPVVPDGSCQQKAGASSGTKPMLFTKTIQGKALTELNDLLKDAAFMVLQMCGELDGRNWLSMRCLADGLDALDEYRQTTKDDLLKTAKENFASAVAADMQNHHALYSYGSMLLYERAREPIAMAIRLFLLASKTKETRLKALANTGLAQCYAQQYHRLAKRDTGVLAKAEKYAKIASQQWKEVPKSGPLHPLILYTLALSMIVDEGAGHKAEEVRERFGAAAEYLRQAIESEPDNAKFYNALGWLFLKLAQRQINLKAEAKAEDGASRKPEKVVSSAERAEYYSCRALDLNPQNKLTHANLCLLYAMPPYLGEEKYLIRCRYHGRKAIKLDREYINGHRDLAMSLIRYGEFEEAEGYFKKALRLAAVVDKDLEIIEDTVKLLNSKAVKELLESQGVGKDILERFSHPPQEFFDPPR
jgi:tetratricopeptide (TPR) repeat protein